MEQIGIGLRGGVHIVSLLALSLTLTACRKYLCVSADLLYKIKEVRISVRSVGWQTLVGLVDVVDGCVKTMD